MKLYALTNLLITFFLTFFLTLFLTALIRPVVYAQTNARINTDKETYHYGETIKVNYFNAPGHEKDWICIVPEGSPDTEGGDYQYIPEGSNQGTLSFETTSPGKYEARAYYNYLKKGYTVSARQRFAIKSTTDYEKKVDQALKLIERPLNQQVPMESKISPGNGLIYIFRESWYLTESLKIQILANDKDLFVLPDASYYLYSVPAGQIKLSSRRYTTPENRWDMTEIRNSEIIIHVKAGHAYYLRVRMVQRNIITVLMDNFPHEEGAAQIESGKLTLIN